MCYKSDRMTTQENIKQSGEIRLRRLDASFTDWSGLLDLILRAFAYMDGTIAPPSSAHRLTAAELAEKAATELGYVALQGGHLLGCVFLKPEPPDVLYLGKIAVAPAAQGRGIGLLLFEQALAEARSRGLSRLRLETRIELTGNHACFARWGFVKTADRAHPGFTRTTSIEMQRAVG